MLKPDLQALTEALRPLLAGDVYRILLTAPEKDSPYRKITLDRMQENWFVEKFTEKQAFHEHLPPQEAEAFLLKQMEAFSQLHAWDEKFESRLRVTKKGKVLRSRSAAVNAPAPRQEHNRAKRSLLPEGTVIPPLVDMGVFTAEGKIVTSMYDKYRQINRFVELIDDALPEQLPDRPLRVIDFGCGKSYLTFILYYYFTAIRGIRVQMVGLDLKEEVIRHCNEAARKYGYDGLRFALGDINGYKTDAPPDMVVTLHACDTATDFALYNAVCWQAPMIFSVPCCQHELDHQMQSETFSLLTDYGIIKERTAALFTDAIRAALLTACGYKTQILEFVDLSHTPKNLLIRARKGSVPMKKRLQELQKVKALCEEFHLSPTLLQLLQKDGLLPKE